MRPFVFGLRPASKGVRGGAANGAEAFAGAACAIPSLRTEFEWRLVHSAVLSVVH